MELKNCPFCGKSQQDRDPYCVCASDELMRMLRVDWNTRPLEDAKDAEIEKLNVAWQLERMERIRLEERLKAKEAELQIHIEQEAGEDL